MVEKRIEFKYNTEEQVISKQKFDPMLKYTLISSRDITVNNVHFKKNRPVKMTGILAKLCLENGNGWIKLYDEQEETKKKEFEKEIEKVIEKKLEEKVSKGNKSKKGK